MAGVGLAGCADTIWTKPGVSTSERDAALAECADYADREQTEDFVSRIEDTQRGVSTGDDESVLRADFRRHDERSRRSDLLASCMRGLGYDQVEVPDAEDAGGPADAS